jgi:phage shock protein A
VGLEDMVSCLEARIAQLEQRVAELEGEQEQPAVVELTFKIDNEVLAKQVIKNINDYQKKNSHILLLAI